MPTYSFGSGQVWGFRTDIDSPTPVKIFDLQESSVDLSRTGKGLYGSNQFAIAYAAGEAKLTGKLKFARQQARILSDFYLGTDLATGQIDVISGEKLAIGPSVAVANAATFLFDNGVINALTGRPFIRMNQATKLSTGQYSVDPATGKYAFADADVTAGALPIFSYGYSVQGAGQHVRIYNSPQGYQPAFQLTLQDVYNSPLGVKKKTLIIYAAVSTKYSESGKSGDWKAPELDFEAIDNGSGVIADFSFNEAS